MVRLGHLSLDGSKYQANASRHQAMSYGRMAEAADQLEAEVQELLDRAAAMDEAEDAEYGAAVRGDELPEELRRREERLTRIPDKGGQGAVGGAGPVPGPGPGPG